ncbi:ScbA/BarX family gamma-butyrolactone biosynthesis protein [Streptomyces sp. NPDC048324]|uniref:ScbA/BarX family gamma-butyrolactone biosynthesis protein n=1 Tax=Streptomyces sp. NPDC048324 TaxID=3157205 RepID=UPI00344A72A7
MPVSTYRTNRAIPGMTHTQHPGAPTGSAPLLQRLTSTVPKELVHRASIAEVLLTDWARSSAHHFVLAAQWPRGHSFYTPIDGCHDPLIAAETIRQAGLLLAHTEYHVPLGHHFLLHHLDVSTRPAHMRMTATPATLELHVHVHDIKERRGEVTGLRIDVAIHRDGHLAATGGGTLTCIAPRIHQRLRGMQNPDTLPVLPLTAPEPPQKVGRTSPTDVVLSPLPEPHHWQLRIDTRHPTLFDHPLDHAPGMLLIEAARQATTATLGHPTHPHTITTHFHHYVELHTPCTIKARPTNGTIPHGDTRSILVTAQQNGADVFHCTLTTTPPHA